MRTAVYIIRHAEAEGNVYRRCHGQYNALLTTRAYKQLPYLAKRFENVPLAAVYSSDLFRARVTAQAVAEPHHLSVETRRCCARLIWETGRTFRGPSCRTHGLSSTRCGVPVRGKQRRRTARRSCRPVSACWTGVRAIVRRK